MCVVREGVCMSRCVDGRPHPLTPLTSDPKLNAPAACFVDMDVQQHRCRTAALQRPAGVAQPMSMSTPPGGRDRRGEGPRLQGPLRHRIDEERVDAIIIVFVFMSARDSLRRLAEADVQHQHRRCKKPPPHGTLLVCRQ